MKRIALPHAFAALMLLTTSSSSAQRPQLRPQYNLAQWDVKPANYSGITCIDDTTYALVDDKSDTDGFYIFNIHIDPRRGKITSVRPRGFFGPSRPEPKAKYSDCEDIVWVEQSRTLFITHESTAQVKEYTLSGEPTGRQLHIPDYIGLAQQRPNGGFESLAYSPQQQTYWLTTECALKGDTANSRDRRPCQSLRIVSFDSQLQPQHWWSYTMDPAELSTAVRYYTHGVSAITPVGDGRLLILERELSIPPHYLGGRCRVKIYLAAEGREKRQVSTFTTRISLLRRNYANYEGMCLGPRLNDGRQTLLLINDSQAGAGNSLYRLKDYIRVIVLPTEL